MEREWQVNKIEICKQLKWKRREEKRSTRRVTAKRDARQNDTRNNTRLGQLSEMMQSTYLLVFARFEPQN